MDPLHTTKKFGICSSHIEEYFLPANEFHLLSVATKPKITCKFVSIYSSYIVSSDTVFQKKFIYVVHCSLISKIFVFWLKQKISSARASDQFLTKIQIWVFSKKLRKSSKVLKLASFSTLTTLFRLKNNSNFLFEKKSCFCFSKKHSLAQEDGFCKRSNFPSYKHCSFPFKTKLYGR